MTTDTTTSTITSTPKDLGPQPQTFHVPPVAVPCPDWCTVGEGHGYDMEDLEGWDQRHHTRDFARGEAFVDVGAVATWRGDHEEVGPLTIRSGWNDIDPDMTAEQAHDMGEALLEAVAWLEAQA